VNHGPHDQNTGNTECEPGLLGGCGLAKPRTAEPGSDFPRAYYRQRERSV